MHGISQSSISRSLDTVIELIASQKNDFISFPTENEFHRLSTDFFEMQGFPGVIGAIDGTHVPIVNPGGNDAELYRNRKGYFSINVQLLCDSKLLIRNVVASWRGSTHDARIFSESVLKQKLMTIPQQYHVLGDRGYPCLPYLLTPVANPRTQAERNYNFAHSSTRMVIERVNGILKRRFPCLSFPLRFSSRKCCIVIVACTVLHNIARVHNDFDDENNAAVNNLNNAVNIINGNAQGFGKRQAIITNNFTV